MHRHFGYNLRARFPTASMVNKVPIFLSERPWLHLYVIFLVLYFPFSLFLIGSTVGGKAGVQKHSAVCKNSSSNQIIRFVAGEPNGHFSDIFGIAYSLVRN